MAASYKKLWKLLIDKDMKKEDLRKAAGLTTTAMAKLGRNEDVKTSVLLKICNVLHCDISDIMEIINIADVLIVLGDFYSPQGNWCFVTAVYLPLLSVYR